MKNYKLFHFLSDLRRVMLDHGVIEIVGQADTIQILTEEGHATIFSQTPSEMEKEILNTINKWLDEESKGE